MRAAERSHNQSRPLVDSRQTTLSGGVYSPVWMNAKTFQILCPGLDGSFGNYFGTSGGSVSLTVGGTTITGVPCGFYPSGVNYPPNTPDDITNFTTGATLQDDMAPIGRRKDEGGRMKAEG